MRNVRNADDHALRPIDQHQRRHVPALVERDGQCETLAAISDQLIRQGVVRREVFGAQQTHRFSRQRGLVLP
jgi:hypothetical protein